MICKKRIDKGQVPGAKAGDDPRKYVKKGHFTYSQSYNITRAGSIEGLAVDVSNGVISASVGTSITMLLTFAGAVWNGKDIKEAAKISINSGLHVMGKTVFIYTVSMQLSRSTIINPFVKEYTKDGISKGFGYIDNPVFNLAESLSNTVNKSKVANSSVGKSLGLNKTTGKKLIGGSVMVAVVFGPDICNALRGKISTKQLFKNASISTAGLVGASLGQALIPIPFAGAMIGGAVSSIMAKKVLDNFVEDDAKEMYRILKQEFLDIVIPHNLTKEEFSEIVELTLGSSKLQNILKDMYQYGEHREYARDLFIGGALQIILSKREKISEDMLTQGLIAIAEEVVA